uniref:Protein kinase domain-containing protein n=1 Tax=Rhabditophanes sp. KR3021 TaxID=114890 RepID=A0AC35U0E0_9BILA
MSMIDNEFREKVAQKREKVDDLYHYRGQKIGSGAYGQVYKAISKDPNVKNIYALKLIDGQGTNGIAMSVCREISLVMELKCVNIIKIHRIFFAPEKKIWLLFDYAEHDLWHIIKYHRTMKVKKERVDVSASMIKSILFQILQGIDYLHENWILHRDIKPANILVMGEGIERGTVKIADMGFARIYHNPLKPLTHIDPIVVTYWYRSPELLLGTKHYTKAIDLWAIGCIFAELMISEPIFYCPDEDTKASTPYNKGQIRRILQILGYPNEADWKDIKHMPNYTKFLQDFNKTHFTNCCLKKYIVDKHKIKYDTREYVLLKNLLIMDPIKRITAAEALSDEFFRNEPEATKDVFNGLPIPYPKREFIIDKGDDLLTNLDFELSQPPKIQLPPKKLMEIDGENCRKQDVKVSISGENLVQCQRKRPLHNRTIEEEIAEHQRMIERQQQHDLIQNPQQLEFNQYPQQQQFNQQQQLDQQLQQQEMFWIQNQNYGCHQQEGPR